MKSIEERMVSGDLLEMLQAQQEFLENVRKSQEENLKKLNELEKTIKAQIEKMGQKKS